MKANKQKKLTALIISLFCCLIAGPSEADETTEKSLPLPKGWIRAGDNPQEYQMGIDSGMDYKNKHCAAIKSIVKEASGFGTLMQGFDATPYLGKRLRLSAWLKAGSVKGWTGLWMRIDGKGKNNSSLAFDNMQNRPITGDTEWTNYEVVLDVPENSSHIAYGVLLSGIGNVWMTDFSFETVSQSVPVTDITNKKSSYVKAAPTNLDFSEGAEPGK